MRTISTVVYCKWSVSTKSGVLLHNKNRKRSEMLIYTYKETLLLNMVCNTVTIQASAIPSLLIVYEYLSEGKWYYCRSKTEYISVIAVNAAWRAVLNRAQKPYLFTILHPTISSISPNAILITQHNVTRTPKVV